MILKEEVYKMKELNIGQSVPLTNGDSVTVIKELGRGGQGIVYLAELGSKRMALKWYLHQGEDSFYKNLENNITSGAPSEAFLWPKYLTKKIDGYFGYVMDLRPDGYYEFGSYLIPQSPKGQKFHSFTAITNAALKICEGFKFLHLKGYSYQDLNDGNFFINPDSGDVFICDNDNVMAQGCNSGIGGKAHYMAPEIVAGEKPDKYSDRLSLSIILFRMFFLDHPFDGERVAKCPCLTDELDRKFFGNEATFIFDPIKNNNRPVPGIHINALRRWPIFPRFFKETFIQEFCEDKLLRSKNTRKLEQAWENILIRLRDSIVKCPICGEETIIDGENTTFKCVNCGKIFTIDKIIKFSNRTFYLTNGSYIFFDPDNIPDAKVEKNPKDGMIMFKNLSDAKWMVETPSGKLKEVAKGESFPSLPNIKVTVTVTTNGSNNRMTGTITLNK